MFTDNKDFYPTPKNIIDKMLEGINFEMVSTVLEPSAGKGDLAAGITEAYQQRFSPYSREEHKPDLDCIELQPELQNVLRGKGYRVVHDDFLTYNTFKRYSLIVSNPPFSQGTKHLLKMLDMQKDGGSIVCLLNAETLRNPCNSERKVLLNRLEELQADITYMDGAFSNSERKTNVEVALVKVFVPEKEKESFIFQETLKKSEIYQENYSYTENTSVADSDFIKAITQQYRIEVATGIMLIDEYKAMKPHILKAFGENVTDSSLLLSLNNRYERITNEVTKNDFIKAVRQKYWDALFENPTFIGKLTSNLLMDYRNRVADLADYDFSEFNIYQIKAEMSKSVVKGVEEAIVTLFDKLSHEHSYYDNSTNIHYFNGWKTNKSWIINKKVIIPLNAYSWYDKRFDPDYVVHDKLSDIEKGLNYLDGGLTDSVDLDKILLKAKEDNQTRKIRLKYFTVTFYKKGTCHIEFTNLELLKKFNIFGAQRKGWLPPSYGKKTYSQMDEEEKAVVDEFEGKKSYEEVIANTKYYICETDNLLKLSVN